MTRNPRVDVTIGRLVLHGFPAEQREAIAASLQESLRRQFADPALAREVGGSRHVAALRTRPIAADGGGARRIGAGAAREIARSIRS
jgi:hypothetical protein